MAVSGLRRTRKWDPELEHAICTIKLCCLQGSDACKRTWAKHRCLGHRYPGPGRTTASKPTYCQSGRTSAILVQLSPDALTSHAPDWVTTSAVQPTFWDSDSFNFERYGRQLAHSRCNLGGGSVWDVVVQLSPGLNLLPILVFCPRPCVECWYVIVCVLSECLQ